MMTTITVDLSKELEFFRLLTAEWWDENSKFVVVRGSTKKDPENFALRLDLEKRAFLDHLSNPKTDELVQSQVLLISQLVWHERLRQRNAAGTSVGRVAH
jgi:hypothetical protein